MSASSTSTSHAQASSLADTASHQSSGSNSSATVNALSYLSNYAADVANSWLLPDGVSDVLFDEAQKQEMLRHKLIQQLISHGYQLVSPPLIEYTESLLNNASEDLKRQTFKIIDQLTGRLMGLRADITPQILRIDSYHGTGVARYCYAGHVIHTLPSGLFGSRTPLQLGAEIFGCHSLNADIELLDVLFTMLDDLNMQASLHIDLGHVAIFKRLSVIAQLSNSDTEQLMTLYANKNLPELKRLSQTLAMGADFYALARYGHDMAQLLDKLSATAMQDTQITEAVDELQRLQSHLKQRWQCEVSIDVTELSGYHYHTGIVFNGYMNNETQPLVRGGRFDGMQSSSPSNHKQATRGATGFSLEVSRLLAHIKLDKPTVVVVDYEAANNSNNEQQRALQLQIEQLRQQGHRVILPLDHDDQPANTTHHLSLVAEQWQLKAI